jgi:hypothetical protein
VKKREGGGKKGEKVSVINFCIETGVLKNEREGEGERK